MLLFLLSVIVIFIGFSVAGCDFRFILLFYKLKNDDGCASAGAGVGGGGW